MRAVLAEWSPDDTENLQALSVLYVRAQAPASSCNSKPRRKNATVMVLVWWRHTELVDLLPARLEYHGWLARALAAEGVDGKARQTFAEAVDQAVANQDDTRAKATCDQALERYPNDRRLQRAAATIAERANDRLAAAKHWRNASLLARVAGDSKGMVDDLQRLLAVRPRDVQARVVC